MQILSHMDPFEVILSKKVYTLHHLILFYQDHFFDHGDMLGCQLIDVHTGWKIFRVEKFRVVTGPAYGMNRSGNHLSQ